MNKDKAELEEQLRQKEEQLQTKDRENAELKQQLHQKEEQIRAKNKCKAELDQQLYKRGAYYISSTVFNAVGSAGTYFIACTQQFHW